MRINITLIILLMAATISFGQDGSQERQWTIEKDRVERKYGTVNLSGDTIIPFVFDRLRIVNDSVVIANVNEKWYLLNAEGERKSNAGYRFLSQSKDDLLLFYTDSLVGAIDPDEQVIIEPKYEFLYQFNSNLFSATINKKKGLINIDEDIVVPFEYNGLLMYLDVIFLRKNLKWAIADKNGKLQSDYIYKWVHYKKGDDFITLSMDGERIKIDSEGNKI